MGIQIEDGEGQGNIAGVTDQKQLKTFAIIRGEVTHISEESGRSFIAETNFTTTGTNQTFFYLKNDDTNFNLHINRIIFNTDTNTMFHLYKATGTTSGGSAVTPTNINFSSSKTATVTCLGAADITGITETKLHHARMPAHGSFVLEWVGAMILGQGDAISIECTTNTTFATCSVGFYLD